MKGRVANPTPHKKRHKPQQLSLSLTHISARSVALPLYMQMLQA